METKVYGFLRLGRNTAHIARVTGMSKALIYVYRNRIKKKIGLPQAKNQPPHLKPLTPRQREAMMRLAEGRTHREIASLMGISEQAVTTLLYLARKRKAAHEATTLNTLDDPAFL